MYLSNLPGRLEQPNFRVMSLRFMMGAHPVSPHHTQTFLNLAVAVTFAHSRNIVAITVQYLPWLLKLKEEQQHNRLAFGGLFR